ncbi:DUF4870 domain-containing protein [Pseudoxanthomonas sp.]|uniref:DUF4870 domain-containing protein n=1 Tax=Pseudoxanthomonas sp. TaxID=1871049 RepID=UPI0025D9E52D|nr:DUF4870 domain-containing protein [Pseudoxanthomonas sp.]
MSTSNVSPEERSAALITYLLTAFLGIIGAVIGWAVFKDKGPFAKDQTSEALNWAISVTIAFILLWIVVVVLAMVSAKLAVLGSLLYMALGLASFILCIIAALKAKDGTAYRFPFGLRLVK